MERTGSEPAVDREELQAAIEARRELGAEMETHVIGSFVERIERRLDARPKSKPERRRGGNAAKSLALAIVSLVAAIPITAIAATHGGINALIVVWAGIVLVNAAYAQLH
jgi:hypothetical protein